MLPAERCVGCAACVQVCPKSCITMQSDPKGFLHPQIDSAACVDCKACEKVCQVSAPVEKYPLPKKVYAARIKQNDELKSCSSGGIASLLAETVVKDGGIVYGAAFDENLQVRHIRVTDAAGLKKLQGSKYVQSDIQTVYSSLRRDLGVGKKVLVIGTPCQIAGVRKIFGEKRDMLLCDLVCHSVPSPRLFADHIHAIEAGGKKVKDYRFRDKAFGWSYNLNRIIYQDGSTELHSYWNQCYKRLFLLNLIQRESCYTCSYTDCRRVGDITLGDYWGVNKVTDRFADDKGVNVVFLNTEKALTAVETLLREQTEWMETSLEDTLQVRLIMPCQKTAAVDSFWSCYENTSYRVAAERFAGNQYYLTLRNRLKDFLREYQLLAKLKK